MDRHDKQTRSRIMSAIRSKGNRTTELRLRAYLVRAGIRGWRINAQSLAGKPDFVFTTARVAVFIDGCFWHGCPRCLRRPESNRVYWENKIERNRANDKKATMALEKDGWTVLRFWEHELKRFPMDIIEEIHSALTDRESLGQH